MDKPCKWQRNKLDIGHKISRRRRSAKHLSDAGQRLAFRRMFSCNLFSRRSGDMLFRLPATPQSQEG